ncbi:MAG: hypothetical protein GJU72_07425 [Acidithiobacillus ferriphilus]|nr:hypothetical protein [Acidithiobacillus ferriphilus]MBW9254107.1 hypothetical protein [Acidithiobacillus ferriphilus]
MAPRTDSESMPLPTVKSAFWSLPTGTQTAIVDLAFQYGPNLSVRTPNYWKQVTTGQWQAAIDNLRNFGDAYGPRRNAEANLISADIANGELPPDASECEK